MRMFRKENPKPPALLEKLADKYDLFGAEVSAHNFEGRKSVYTSLGLCWTTLLLLVSFSYGIEQFIFWSIQADQRVFSVDTRDKFLSVNDTLDLASVPIPDYQKPF